MTKEQILKKIIDLEAEKANIGAQVNKLENEYCKFSPINKGDKILYREWYDAQNSEMKKGIVSSVSFDSSRFFRYRIQPCTKNFTKHKKRGLAIIQPKGINSRGQIQLFNK